MFINACRLLSALPLLSRFHSTCCRYFLGHVACQTLPWQGLRRVFFIHFLEKLELTDALLSHSENSKSDNKNLLLEKVLVFLNKLKLISFRSSSIKQ